MDIQGIERDISVLVNQVRICAGLYKTALQTNVDVAEACSSFVKAAQELEAFIKSHQVSPDLVPIGQKPGPPPMTFGYFTGYLSERKAEISKLEEKHLQRYNKAGTGLVPQPA